jgi:5'-nucleotidase / UDP-sugar diphosphatase
MIKKITAPIVVMWFLFIAANGLWAGEPVQIRLLFLNDFHGFAEPHQPIGSPGQIGGLAYLATEVNRLRQERPTLLLAAGDMIQGNPWANLFEGKSTIEVMNAMGFSAMVLGNHEFDFGQKTLSLRIKEARFPILTANILGLSGIQPYLIKEIAGIKIAIIGLVTEETPTATHPKNVEGLTFLPAAESAQKVLQELGNRPDLVLVLSHLGLPADRRLAETVKGIQVVVGGHTHTRIETPIKVNETIIVQAWEHAKVLGVLDLTIQDRKVINYQGKLLPISPDNQRPDPLIAEIVDRYKNQSAAMLDEVIGEALVDLQGKGARSRETNLGNLVADVMREDAKADAALTNAGGLRADILKGPIRMKDLFSVLPFPNHLVVLRVTGRELKEILEHGLSDLSGTGGQFPQVSGMRLTYKFTAPSGQRITAVWIQEKPLDPETWYTLATNDFLLAGGDGYAIFKKILQGEKNSPTQNPRVILFDSGRELRDLVVAFIREKKQVSASAGGRIQKIE